MKKSGLILKMLLLISCMLLITSFFMPKNSFQVILKGIVECQSIHHQKDGSISFRIVDQDKQGVKIVYRGKTTTQLVDGSKVVIKGNYTVENVFLADEVVIEDLGEQNISDHRMGD